MSNITFILFCFSLPHIHTCSYPWNGPYQGLWGLHIWSAGVVNVQWVQSSTKYSWIRYSSLVHWTKLRGRQELEAKPASVSREHKGDEVVAACSFDHANLFSIPEYILEPPPCRSEPENCTKFCTQQEECPGNLQCCSAFCGIVCASNKDPTPNM